MLVNHLKSNEAVSKILEEISRYLELEGENVHKISTYKRASLIVRMLPYDIALMENLTSIKGIGNSLSSIISEILDTGTCALIIRLRRKYEEQKNGESRK